ncbi:hypothetical protein U2054_15700, partial [Listeria monocytogenes]|uniref:hypothetical protein n=1 Tax=Listeria monocytogenes TaxID=1639 RepID=UPI002FDBD4D4
MIKCGATGRLVTSETHRKTYSTGRTDEWIYLRAWDSSNLNRKVYVKEETILKEVEKVFAEMYLDHELLEEVI